ncbi:MAG TPA: 1-deoxy-D-xylulose-5-phosphate synthase, partial [Spirochaetaceae bacterium]|nr:1-deoxy-D-xylulose-5-phosphate synthase [Spirochaetaceae bacterium]
MSLLDRISEPSDLKSLSISELHRLAKEIRQYIIETVQRNGGHLASNLGVVELTIALHRVFDSPVDAIVWDVGHQCYPHKILTGRAERFGTLRRQNGISGFPKRQESEHDIFDTGHSSTAISSSLGLLQARMRTGQAGRVIAVVGDGALTAGMAMEGLSNAGQLGLPLILVLNDNRMSISRSVGSISRYLSKLSASVRYQSLRTRIDATVLSIPHIGRSLFSLINRVKRAVKAIFFKENLFVDFGFEYVGPIDGHNISALIDAFSHVRELNRPVVVHVVTKKGKGLGKAEEDPESFHGLGPACPDIPGTGTTSHGESFTTSFADALVRIAEQDHRVVAVTAAMSSGTGVVELGQRLPQRVFDVGIAEQHAVAFAAGLARGGLRPVVAIYSTFMQRAVDQVFQEVALAKLPVLFALDRAGAVGEDGETHQGIYDIALFKSLPNLVLFAPADSEELSAFMSLALRLNVPCMMRYPKAYAPCPPKSVPPLEIGKGVFVQKRDGAKVLVLAVGPLAHTAAEVSDTLAKVGLFVDVYNVRFLAPVDEDDVASLCAQYEGIVIVEDGVRVGGFGESITALLARRGVKAKIAAYGFERNPCGQASREELLAKASLDAKGIQKTLGDMLQSIGILPQAPGCQAIARISSLPVSGEV